MSQLSGIKLSKPKMDDIIPSTQEKVKIKPFTVGDEKVLLMASQSNEPGQMVNAISDVINNCVERESNTPLAFFDIEYLFVKIRSISVGEVAKFGYKCTGCGEVNEVSVDLSKVNVSNSDKHQKNIKIDENLMFEMQYPTIETIMSVDLDDYSNIIEVLIQSVKTVYYGEEVIDITYAEYDDLRGIIESLSSTQFKELANFLNTMPKLREELTFECTSCQKENKAILEGMKSFF